MIQQVECINPTVLFASPVHPGLNNFYMLLVYMLDKSQSICVCVFSDVSLAAASSAAGALPSANSFTNTNHRCGDVLPGSGGTGRPSNNFQQALCSEGSACLKGDLGVYCECYYPMRTINSSKQVFSFYFLLKRTDGVTSRNYRP